MTPPHFQVYMNDVESFMKFKGAGSSLCLANHGSRIDWVRPSLLELFARPLSPSVDHPSAGRRHLCRHVGPSALPRWVRG